MFTPAYLSVQTTVHAPIQTVWDCWTTPAHIMHWNHASPDWHTTTVTQELRRGGEFSYHMEARDGSAGFDFAGMFTHVAAPQALEYELEDGREVEIEFHETPQGVVVRQLFRAEDQNPAEAQRAGWQAILDNFKAYAEAQA